MQFSFAVGAVLAASLAAVSANSCNNGAAINLGGNYYCSAVESIAYNNFGSDGSYKAITSMENGVCTSETRHYSGPLAPLDDVHSFHFRGPLWLKQFAVYSPGSEELKRSVKPSFRQRRHGHSHLHRRTEAQEKVAWPGEEAPSSPAPVDPSPVPKPSPSPKPEEDEEEDDDVPLFGWGRKAYYNAESGEADGLVFLNHHGGQGSGTFDYNLGNSLSYASEDGQSGSSSPQVLKDMLLPDNKEIVIMSDRKCNGDSCGTVRPGTVAYHGFAGKSKIYLLELSMPMSGKKGFNMDMPAAWILNAQIPRTLQYGPAECSCWKSGCGEFDVLEVLDSGNTRCKSTLHGNIAGGDSHFFNRPTDGPIKVAVFFNHITSSAHIKILDDDFDFGTSLSGGQVAKLTIESALSSIFHLGN